MGKMCIRDRAAATLAAVLIGHEIIMENGERLGQTFVIVTHDEGLSKITDRTIHMVDGIIKKD